MKPLHTLRFTISFFIIVLGTSGKVLAYHSPYSKDSISSQPKTISLLRLGADLYKSVISLTDNNYTGFEIVADWQLHDRFFLAGEVGSERKVIQSNDNLNFTTSGSYIKVGVDFNFLDNWTALNNQIYLGARLATSRHNQQVNAYLVYNLDHFWEEEETNTGFAITKHNNLNALWLEFPVGLKVELLQNFYAGFSLRLKILINSKEPNNFSNLYIPGFNRKTDNNGFGACFNYTLSYRFAIRTEKPIKQSAIE